MALIVFSTKCRFYKAICLHDVCFIDVCRTIGKMKSRKEEFVDFKKSIIGHPTPANKLDVNGANVQQTVTLFNWGNKHKSHKPEVVNLFQPLMTTMKCFSCLA